MPDAMVLCVIAVFGVSVAQRVHYIIRHDHGSLLRSIYEKTGLLLDLIILGLQVFCKLRRILFPCFTKCNGTCVEVFDNSPAAVDIHTALPCPYYVLLYSSTCYDRPCNEPLLPVAALHSVFLYMLLECLLLQLATRVNYSWFFSLLGTHPCLPDLCLAAPGIREQLQHMQHGLFLCTCRRFGLCNIRRSASDSAGRCNPHL